MKKLSIIFLVLLLFSFAVSCNKNGNSLPSQPENKVIKSQIIVPNAIPTFVLQWGSLGTGDNQFHSPSGIAIDASDKVYVTDTLNNPGYVKKFDANGNFILKWVGQLISAITWSPVGISIGASQNIYVGCGTTDVFQEFTSIGGFLNGLSSSSSPQRFTAQGPAIAADSSGNVYFYALDLTNIESVFVYSSNFSYITHWPANTVAPLAIAIDVSNDLYVPFSFGNIVTKYTASGTSLAQIGGTGSGNGLFSNPQGVCTDSSGNLYVADHDNNLIQVFNLSGNFVTQWGGFGIGPGQFHGPMGVAVDSKNNIYVVDSGNNRIEKFTFGTPSTPVATTSITNTPTVTIALTETSTPTVTPTTTLTDSPTITPTLTFTSTFTNSPTPTYNPRPCISGCKKAGAVEFGLLVLHCTTFAEEPPIAALCVLTAIVETSEITIDCLGHCVPPTTVPIEIAQSVSNSIVITGTITKMEKKKMDIAHKWAKKTGIKDDLIFRIYLFISKNENLNSNNTHDKNEIQKRAELFYEEIDFDLYQKYPDIALERALQMAKEKEERSH